MNFKVPPESSLIKRYVCRSPDSASMAPTSSATTQDTSVDLNWEWAKRHSKQLCSGKQITLVGGYCKMRIMTKNLILFLKCDVTKFRIPSTPLTCDVIYGCPRRPDERYCVLTILVKYKYGIYEKPFIPYLLPRNIYLFAYWKTICSPQ